MKLSFLTACLFVACTEYAVAAEQSNQDRIDKLMVAVQPFASQDPLSRYHAYKAKMWLSYALNQSSEKGWTSAGQEALEQAQQMIDQLKAGQQPTLITPILSVSQVMRRDLWLQVEYLKQQGGIEKAPESLAHAEIMLVWGAAEYCELGWRHANAHFKAAEEALHEASEKSDIHRAVNSLSLNDLPSLQDLNGKGCNSVNAKLWPLLKAQPYPEAEGTLVLQNIVHFALDSAQLSLNSQKLLDQLSVLLHAHPQIEVVLAGYTDPRANTHYNLDLAQHRIGSVKDYLLAQRIEDGRMREVIKGAQDFVEDQDPVLSHAKSRRVVLELNNTGELNIQFESKPIDLQIENRN